MSERGLMKLVDRKATERAAWQLLRSLVTDRNDRKREVCEALDMSFVRVKALRTVATAPLAMRDLASAIGADAPYTTVIVDDLEKRGLVVRSPHPDDRRAKVVNATADGRRAARKANVVLGTPPASMRALSDDDLAELHRLLAAVLG